MKFHEMYRHRWTVCVHWSILSVSAFWFALLACRKLLAASDRNAYSSSSTLVQSASAIPRLLATPSSRLIGRAVHLESCTPGQDWAKWYILVRTSTYRSRYNRDSIRQSRYDNFTVVRTGIMMYRYIPVRTSTFSKTSCFLTHPERVRRDKIKVVQPLCMGYNVTKSNFKTTQA